MLQIVWKKKTSYGTEKKVLQVSDLGPDLERQLYEVVTGTAKRLSETARKKNVQGKK